MPPFDLAKRPDTKVIDPTETPVICKPPEEDGFWPDVCWSDFVTYTEISENNYELAQINADNTRDAQAAYDAILSAARQQAQIAQIRQEMLIRERRDAFWSIWLRNGIIALGIVGVLL